MNWKPEQLEVTNVGVKSIYSAANNPYVAETEAFLHALRTGDTSGIRSSYADAIKTQRVTTAALESARSGKAIRIQEA
ncbi:hypothetical protein D3C81_2051380 [compost metagenome]